MARLQIRTQEPDISTDVIVPEYLRIPHRSELSAKEYYSHRDLPVLWLLHGAEGNCADWMRYSQIEVFAEEKGIIVICPSFENSFCVNMARGISWEDNFVDKVWPLMQRMLPTSDRWEHNAIAGVGMGGYGALKIALDFPELFSCAGSFDGWIDTPQKYAAGTCDLPDDWALQDVFGDPANVVSGPNDLYHLAEICAKRGKPLPELYISCGDSGECQQSITFREATRVQGFDVTWVEVKKWSGWRSVNQQLDDFVKWLEF